MYNYYKTDSQFYPTPAEVIDLMMQNEDVCGKKILEPSAGTGNIVRWCKQHGAREVIACEIDDYLRRIVSQECRVIDSDFRKLRREDVAGVDYIIMNPPFHSAAEHINHALDIAPAGSIIVALCNHSNFDFRNYASKKTEEYKLKENCRKYGEHYNLGPVFKDADRRTNCEIECVKLFKPGEGENEFTGFMFDNMPDDMGNGAAGLMRYDVVRDVVQRYICTVQRFETTLQMCETINQMAKFPDDVLCQQDEEGHKLRGYNWEDSLPARFGLIGNDGKVITDMDVYEYKKTLQRYYWRVIFQRLNIEKDATAGLREQMAVFIERNANRPFTMHNIYRMLNTIIQTRGNRMQTAIVEAFDYICSLSAKNSTAGEKWKTNANYMVNRRFIVDYITNTDYYRRPAYLELNYSSSSQDRIDDVTKALCYLTGRNFDEIGKLYNHVKSNNVNWGEWFEWGFFKCKGFYKGTMHFEFLDEKVWQLFNQSAAKAKGWNLGQK